ncbi:hypothetical protein BIV57_10240 [Mangrovactinospora gilvigrisea]|uniref:PNPLA domain-containing protein n=1 Tax=Mangrovactinospora gilvigrisea TaxID=1428644 RepID=A0A1J7BFW7_9ACTN|nr:patatin-like phospholipase family protein [Mangrovactinospora gilvigrisea]OIV37575.1 hypothetical protein BIV57_10240 [Mangrovactinospora gilvigrisea]
MTADSREQAAAAPTRQGCGGDAHRAPGDLENPGGRGSRRRRRRGLVLGGGGLLGAAWTIGALCAVQEALEWDPRDAEAIVGTSAGSVVGALLAAGIGAEELRDHQRGVRPATGPLAGVQVDYDTMTGGAVPRAPRPGIGSPAMLRRTVRHPRSYPLQTTVSAFLPQGQGDIHPVGRLIEAIGGTGAGSPHPGLRLVAVDYTTGERVAFGDPEAPPAGVADAVKASCAIPGWFAPVVIGDRPYVDGGTWSATSVDLLVGAGLDEVIVLAPMASRETDRPRTVMGRLERRYRRAVTRHLLREARALRSTGTRVQLFGPGPEDLAEMGANMMDPAPRLSVLARAAATMKAQLTTAGLATA